MDTNNFCEHSSVLPSPLLRELTIHTHDFTGFVKYDTQSHIPLNWLKNGQLKNLGKAVFFPEILELGLSSPSTTWLISKKKKIKIVTGIYFTQWALVKKESLLETKAKDKTDK